MRTHFGLGLGLVAHDFGLGLGLESQVLGLGLGLVTFSMTHRCTVYCTDTAAKKVLMIRAKTVISISSFPS